MSISLPGRSNATIDALLRIAARAHPEVEMSPERTRLNDLDALADHYAARWRETEARFGASAVLVAAPTAQSFAAMVGALRAGLALSLAPPEIADGELDAAIVAANALALAGPAHYAGIPVGELLCRVAADQELISLVATHGGKMSGVLELDGARESETVYQARSAFAQIRIFRGGESLFARFDEHELIDAAGAIASRARIGAGETILTTLSCASAAGLAAGPLAALVGGARLMFHAPFDARGFLAAVEEAAPVHLVIPEALASTLHAAGALSEAQIASLILSGGGASTAAAFADTLGGAPVLNVHAPFWGGVKVEATTAAAPAGALDGKGGRAA